MYVFIYSALGRNSKIFDDLYVQLHFRKMKPSHQGFFHNSSLKCIKLSSYFYIIIP